MTKVWNGDENSGWWELRRGGGNDGVAVRETPVGTEYSCLDPVSVNTLDVLCKMSPVGLLGKATASLCSLSYNCMGIYITSRLKG